MLENNIQTEEVKHLQLIKAKLLQAMDYVLKKRCQKLLRYGIRIRNRNRSRHPDISVETSAIDVKIFLDKLCNCNLFYEKQSLQ